MTYPPEPQPSPPPAGPDTDAGLAGDAELIDARAFGAAFGEPLDHALDLGTWAPGGDLTALYGELERQLDLAAADELGHLEGIRRRVLPVIAELSRNTPGLGYFRTTLDEVRRTHAAILFNGGVEACRGTVAAHETLALAVTQLGFSLVSYQGDQGTWGHRLYRRDLRQRFDDIEDQAFAIIEHRQADAADDSQAERRLSVLARRGILAWAERAALLEHARAPWRMGAGAPVPFELVTGAGSMDLAARSVTLLRRLLLEHRRFLFVPAETRDRGFLTIGHALAPLEYVVVDSGLTRLRALTGRANLTRRERHAVDEFVGDVGPALRLGVYRASEVGQPRLFWAHADHVHEAALIAIADSVLHEHRAYPMLLDLAEQVCRGMFPTGELAGASEQAHLASGLPLRYAAV